MALTETAFGEYTLPVQSVSERGSAKFHPGPWGSIGVESGVGLDIGIGWVVFEFEDFEAMYELAKKARENDD